MPGRGSEMRSPGSKATVKSPKAKAVGGRGKVCVFCEQSNINEDLHGKLLSNRDMAAHYFCMLFSSGLSQMGKSEKQGILGFMPNDIMKEVKRGSRLRCSYCRKGGATIGCVVRNCKKMFHLGCGQQNGTLHQFFDTFSSFCPAHRPQQDVPGDEDPSYVCPICMTHVECKPSAETLRAPCCRKAWYHRSCVQNCARSAGLYFFKCPLCNNKDEFQSEMLTYGIYIPDQDASWETEPHAFQELLERHNHCDAKTCRCAEGRKYDKEGSKWELLLCDNCGHAGGHVECGHLIKKGKDYICPDCHEIDMKYFSPKKKLTPKRKSFEPSDLSPIEKQEREAPGPSSRMRKTGLPCIVSTSPDGRGLPASPKRKSAKSREGRPPKKRKRLSIATEQDEVVKKQKLENVDRKTEDKIKSPKKQEVPIIDIIDEANDVKTRRLSLEDFKDGMQYRLNKDKKRTQKKRHSLQPAGTQKTLEGWLKLGSFKPKEKSPETLTVENEDKKVSSLFTKCSKRTPVKRPAVIEYRGEKLEIKSPRVVLRKNIDISGNLKPRVLQLTPSTDIASSSTSCISSTSGIALLADLDNDFRVTRNMVSSVDRGQSPNTDSRSASPSGYRRGRHRKRKSMRVAANKLVNYAYDTNDDLSDDDLTPRSRESFLRSTEKRKVIASSTKTLVGTPASKGLRSSAGTPTSKGLRSSTKKKPPVSNVNCRDFWTISDNDEPVTPTSIAKSEKFASLNGALDELGNNTPDSKSKLLKENQKDGTPVRSSSKKNESLSGSIKGVNISANKKNSPVLRSASKRDRDINMISLKQSGNELFNAESILSKATRSLTDLYQENFDNEFDKYLSENAIPTTDSARNGMKSMNKVSELAMNDMSSQALQLTPKRKTLEETLPRIKRSTKSLSELKSYKREEHDNPNAEPHTDVKMKRKTLGGYISNENDAKNWNTDHMIGGSTPNNKAGSPSRKSSGRKRTHVLLLTREQGQEMDAHDKPVINKLFKVNDTVSTHVGSDVELKGESLIQGTCTGMVSDATKHALKSHLSKSKDKTMARESESISKPSKRELNKKIRKLECVEQKLNHRLEILEGVFERNVKEVEDISTTNIPKELNRDKFAIGGQSKDLKKSPIYEQGMSDRSDSVETGVKVKRRSVSKKRKSAKIQPEESTELKEKIYKILEHHTRIEELNKKSKTDLENSIDSVKHMLASKIEQKTMIDSPVFHVNENKTKADEVKSKIEQKTLIDSPVVHVNENKTKSDKVKSISVSVFISKDKNVKKLTPNKTRNSPRMKTDKEKGVSLLNIVNDTVEKIIIGENSDKNTESGVSVKDSPGPISSTSDNNQLNTGSKKEKQLKTDTKKSSKKNKSGIRSPEKIEQLKGSVEILKKETDKLGKFINNGQSMKNWCENTCPNPQPMLSRKSPRQGASVPEPGSLEWFTSLGELETNNNEIEAKSGESTLSPLYNYYSSLLANMESPAGNDSTIRDTVLMSDSAISQQVSHMLKLKSPASKTMQALAEKIRKSAEKSGIPYAGSGSEEPLVSLSTSPRRVTNFGSIFPNQSGNELNSNKQSSSKVNGIRKEFNLLDNLEATGGDVSSDRLVMSEYYSPKSSIVRKDTGLELDLNDIQPLTNIHS